MTSRTRLGPPFCPPSTSVLSQCPERVSSGTDAHAVSTLIIYVVLMLATNFGLPAWPERCRPQAPAAPLRAPPQPHSRKPRFRQQKPLFRNDFPEVVPCSGALWPRSPCCEPCARPQMGSLVFTRHRERHANKVMRRRTIMRRIRARRGIERANCSTKT